MCHITIIIPVILCIGTRVLLDHIMTRVPGFFVIGITLKHNTDLFFSLVWCGQIRNTKKEGHLSS